MSNQPRSKWADNEETAEAKAQRKREKEEKKLAKAARAQEAQFSTSQLPATTADEAVDGFDGESQRPPKRRKIITNGGENDDEEATAAEESTLLSFPISHLSSCRDVENFDRLNDIEEGSYGWVARAKEKATGEVVALKKLKMDYANDGFPVTGLREIQTLMACKHVNVVRLREVVMGSTLKE